MSDLVSLSKKFNNTIFRIPDYQRGYAWGYKELGQFWDDLINLNDNKFHYTGMLSLRKAKKSDIEKWEEDKWIIENRGYDAYYVIDGQQRITTTIILINEIINLAKELNKTTISDFPINDVINKYIVCIGADKIKKSYIFGYETDNPSFEYWKHKIIDQDQASQLNNSFYTHNLTNAKQFFKDQLRDVLKKHNFDKVEQIFKNVTTKFQFNILEIEDNFEENVAFETMNNRGKKLSNLELLKNRLIYLTMVFPSRPNYDYDENSKLALRKNINEAWREIYYELGRKQNNVLQDDEFLEAHWKIYFTYTRSKKTPYAEFLLSKKFTITNIKDYVSVNVDNLIEQDKLNEDIFDDNNSNHTKDNERKKETLSPQIINDYVNSLKDLSKYWYYTFYPQDLETLTSLEKTWINKLNRLGMSYFRPLIMITLSLNNITADLKIKLFKSIERFIFIYFRLGEKPSNTKDSKFYSLAKDLAKTKSEITFKKIIDELTKMLNDGETLKDLLHNFKAYIRKSFEEGDKEGFYSWKILRYFLFEYEMHLMKEQDTGTIIFSEKNYFAKTEKDKISIEHIYPQTPQSLSWVNQFRQFNENEKFILTHSLGNLLPLSQSINSEISNKDFKDKKERFQNDSRSSREIANFDCWNAVNIYNRSFKLLKFLSDNWKLNLSDQEIKEIMRLDFVYDNRLIPKELNENDLSRMLPSGIKTSKALIKTFWNNIISIGTDNQNIGLSYHFCEDQYDLKNHDFCNVSCRDDGKKRNSFYIHINRKLTHDIYDNISNKTKNICVGIYIRDKEIFQKLNMIKDKIKKQFNFQIYWLVENYNCRIETVIPFDNQFDNDNISDTAGEANEILKQYVSIFTPILNELHQLQTKNKFNEKEYYSKKSIKFISNLNKTEYITSYDEGHLCLIDVKENKRIDSYLENNICKEYVKSLGLVPTNKTDNLIKQIIDYFDGNLKTSTWIIPSDPRIYDVLASFNKNHKVYWGQNVKTIKPGDIAYIYSSFPNSYILCKVEVVSVNVVNPDIDDSEFYLKNKEGIHGKYMCLKLLKTFKPDEMPFSKLKENGMFSIQSQCRLKQKTLDYIKTIEENKNN